MRLLVKGDSHCRTIAEALKVITPNTELYTISVGGQNSDIAAQYRHEIPFINAFRPQLAIIHMGHNDLAWHPTKNEIPAVSRDVSRTTLNLANSISTNHPPVRITISAVYPRTYKHDSILNRAQVRKYNGLAKRHGQRLTTRAEEAGHKALYTKALWKKISIALEESKYFCRDGLHLNSAGTYAIAHEWSAALRLT